MQSFEVIRSAVNGRSIDVTDPDHECLLSDHGTRCRMLVRSQTRQACAYSSSLKAPGGAVDRRVNA